jgi:hypothetical protein
MIYRVPKFLGDSCAAWQKFINNIDMLHKSNVKQKIEIVEEELLRYNAHFKITSKSHGFYAEVDFADEKHYTIFVLQFGTLE